MNAARTSRRPPGHYDRVREKEFDELVELLDIERCNPHSSVFATYIILQPRFADWFVIRLLKRAARRPATTPEERIIMATGRFVIPELVRTYVAPDPVLDRARLTALFLGVSETILALPEDVPAQMTAFILRSVPEAYHADLAGLLIQIAKHKFDSPWANWTPPNCDAKSGLVITPMD